MLRNFIVNVFENSIEVILWLLLILCVVSGWVSSGIMGAVIFLIAGIIFEIVFFGALLVIFDIRNSLSKIKEEVQSFRANKE